MRTSLSAVRSRVDRLALKIVRAQLQDVGPAVARDAPKVVCVYGNELAHRPELFAPR
jgi:hypothetical protein